MHSSLRLPLRFLPAAALGLAVGFVPHVQAEEVTVPTAGGGSWTMTVDAGATPFDGPVRVAMKNGVPEPVDLPAEDLPEIDPDASPDDVPATNPPPAPIEKPADTKAEADDAEPGEAAEEDAPADDLTSPSEDVNADMTDTSVPEPYFVPPAAPVPVTYEAPIEHHAAHAPAESMAISPAGHAAPHAAADYRSVYASIPFNRAEYVANPTYRHDATMEILTGQQRHHAGYTGRTLALPQPSVYRPYLPSRNEFRQTPFPYFGGNGFSGVGYGGIGNGGYTYTGPAALGLGNSGINTGLTEQQFGVVGGYGFGGYGFNGGGFGFGRNNLGSRGFGNRGFGLSPFGERGGRAARPAAPAPQMRGGVSHPVAPMPMMPGGGLD